MVWLVILQALRSSAKTWDKDFLTHGGPMFDGWAEVIKSRIEAQDGKTKEYTGVVGSLIVFFEVHEAGKNTVDGEIVYPQFGPLLWRNVQLMTRKLEFVCSWSLGAPNRHLGELHIAPYIFSVWEIWFAFQALSSYRSFSRANRGLVGKPYLNVP